MRWARVTPGERAEQQAATRAAADERVREMAAAGIRYAAVLDSGTGEDCPACKGLTVVERYPLDELPDVPPADCTCVPWCRCVVIPVE